MPTSEARIRANQANALLSSGPKTPEGKAISRANSFKHGMTGAGVVMPVEEAEEVERRISAFQSELQPTGALGLALVRRAAILSVRMEQCSERDLSATAERVARAMADFEAPAGVDGSEAIRLRAAAGRIAAFDPSKEASLARRYEAAAERGFYKALKELRLLNKQAKPSESAHEAETLRSLLGSFVEMKKLDAARPEMVLPSLNNPRDPVVEGRLATPGGRVDVPFTIGRAR
jgi:hypothetical protein